MESLTKNNRSSSTKRGIQLTVFAVLLIIFTASIFLIQTKAYFPPTKPDPPADSAFQGPGVHYAIGSNRVACWGCTGPEANHTIPTFRR